MKRTVVELSGVPSGPAYETGDDTIASATSSGYPAAAQASSRTARPVFRIRLPAEDSTVVHE